MVKAERSSTVVWAAAAAAQQLSAVQSPDGVLERIVQLAPSVVPGAEHVSITLVTRSRLATATATASASGPVPERVDALQYEVDQGPCLTAARQGQMCVVPNVAEDRRWPQFSSRMAQQDQVRSMLAVPLQAGADVRASLNLSSPALWAFPAASRAAASVFAAVAGLALTAAGAAQQRAADREVREAQVEAFLAMLGHDLRNGVMSMLVPHEVIVRRRALLDEPGRQALEVLSGELGRQQYLLVELLELGQTRCEAAGGWSTSLLSVVQKAVGQHGQAVAVRVHPAATEVTVVIHPVRLGRIVANLLNNADRHGGGATAVELVCSGDRAWVAVEDAGPGVPQTQREWIFTGSAARSGPRLGMGSGLGLALSRQAARSAGGDLRVVDRAGGGARFELLLPTTAGSAGADARHNVLLAAPPQRQDNADSGSPDPRLAPSPRFAVAADKAVQHLTDRLGLDLWAVTQVEHDEQKVIAAAGRWARRTPPGTDLGSWQHSFCKRMIERQGPSLAPDVTVVPGYADAALGTGDRVRAYVGVPLQGDDGQLFGTLCGFAGRPQPDRLADTLPQVRLLGHMLSSLLAGEHAAHARSHEAAAAYALAERDRLTELRDRRGWVRALAGENTRCQRHGSPASVLILDLDDLKTTNDTGGHAAGDHLLTSCSALLTEISRPGDAVARLGGDEFGVLAVECDAAAAHALLTRLQQQLDAAGVAVSAGAATRRAEENLADTWRRADEEMYRNKRRRKHPSGQADSPPK